MTKRIICLLFAICFVVGLLPVSALANNSDWVSWVMVPAKSAPGGAVANIHLDVKTSTPVKGIKIDADGVATNCTPEQLEAGDFNVKAELNAGGIPTLTLKNAVITGGTVCNHTNNNAPLELILIGENTITATHNAFAFNGYDLTISGDGSLTCVSEQGDGFSCGGEGATVTMKSGTIHTTGFYGPMSLAKGDFVMDGGSLTAICSSDKRPGVWVKTGNITVNGGTITTESPSGGMAAVEQGSITINGGTLNLSGLEAKGDITINGGTVSSKANGTGVRSEGGNIVINGGNCYFEATSSYATCKAVHTAAGKMIIKGGVVEAYSKNGSIFTAAPDLSQLSTHNAVAGISSEEASTYSDAVATSCKYFKVEAGVSGGNTTPDNTTPENTTPENTTPENTTPENTTPENTAPENTTPAPTTPAPTTPAPTTPAPTTPNGSNGSPQTGDASDIMLWTTLMIVAAAALVAMSVLGKKKAQ